MAGQGPSRRELLEAIGLASAASVFTGFSRWGYAFAEGSSQQGHVSHLRARPVYRPLFFSPEQYRTIEVLAALILPATHNTKHILQPGAKEAGVPEFIDFMVSSDPALQSPFQAGLAWLEQASSPAESFRSLGAPQQNALLERLAYKSKYRPNEESGQQFFRFLRKYTVTGFYTTRIGLESLDYPGLTFYGTSPGCMHEGNPEHVGL
jgi:hypothetical protein